MPSCLVCGRTRNKTTKCQNISFHKFPTTDLSIRDEWYNFVTKNHINVQKINKYSVLCSSHFKPEHFYLRNTSRLLKKNAVPSLLISRLKGAKNVFPEIVTPCSLSSESTVDKNVLATNNSLNFRSILDKKNSISSFVAFVDTCLDDSPYGLFIKRRIRLFCDQHSLSNKKVKLCYQTMARMKKTITSLKKKLNQSLVVI